MYFQIVQTVDNAAAGTFQAAGPFDVVLLVESGTEFHQYHNILAVFGSLDQRLHNFAVGCDTIQGHLDGDHLGISASLVQQRQERTDALIGERQEAILFLDLFDHALGQVTPCRFLRHTALIEQALVVAEHIPYHRENGEIQRRLRVEYLFLCQIQIAAQRMDDGGIHQTGEFQLDGAELFPFPDQLLHCLTIVAFFLHALVWFDVRIADDSDQRFALDGVPGEDLRCKVQDQFLCQDETVLSGGQGDDLRENAAAARHNAQLFRAFFLQHDNSVNVFVLQEGERLLFADDLRREQRLDLSLEVCLQPCCLLGGDGVEVYDVHALHTQFCTQVSVSVVLVPEQFPHSGVDGGQLFLAGHVGLVFPEVGIFAHLVIQRAAAHHKEFVQMLWKMERKERRSQSGLVSSFASSSTR